MNTCPRCKRPNCPTLTMPFELGDDPHGVLEARSAAMADCIAAQTPDTEIVLTNGAKATDPVPTRTECAEGTRNMLEKLIKETPFLFDGFDIAEMRRRADGYVEFAKYLDNPPKESL